MSLKPDPRQGYFVVPKIPAAPKRWEHIFCGKHEIVGAVCPNCNRPLLKFLSLDTLDPRLNLPKPKFEKLFLLYCWTCQLAQDYFYYVEHGNESVEILHYRRGECYSDFPYENYPIYFPEMAIELQEISNNEQEIIKGLNQGSVSKVRIRKTNPNLLVPSHQIGGEPFLLQPGIEEKANCLRCKASMPFFASIGDAGPAGTQFTMNAFVQVIYHYCRKCSVVLAYHKLD